MADATQIDVERVTGINRGRLSCAECEHIQLRGWEYSAVERVLLEMIRERAAQFAGLLETTDKKSCRVERSSAAICRNEGFGLPSSDGGAADNDGF
jgi:hypothetical protein